MFEQVAEVVRRYEELSDLLASPEVAQDPARIRTYGPGAGRDRRSGADLSPVHAVGDRPAEYSPDAL